MANIFFNNRNSNYIPPNQQMSGPFGNISQMLQNFNQFRSNFRGDPKQQVEQLLKSGQMSQEQFQQLSTLANQFRGIIGR